MNTELIILPKKIVDMQETGAFFSYRFRTYDVSPDGKRFLMIQRDPASVPRQLNVILNWSEEPSASANRIGAPPFVMKTRFRGRVPRVLRQRFRC